MLTNAMNTSQINESNTPSNRLPRILLHIEGLAVLLGAIALYSQQSGEWAAFILLLLVPDVSAIGYLAGQQVGSILYNLAHFYALPIGLAALSLAVGWDTGISLALIWVAHIGMDRAIGYGLKYSSGFKDTHMGRV